MLRLSPVLCPLRRPDAIKPFSEAAFFDKCLLKRSDLPVEQAARYGDKRKCSIGCDLRVDRLNGQRGPRGPGGRRIRLYRSIVYTKSILSTLFHRPHPLGKIIGGRRPAVYQQCPSPVRTLPLP